MEITTAAAPASVNAPRTLANKFPNVLATVLANKAVWLVAAAAFGVELAVSARYGYHRDELYFLSSGQHLALGGVDQPELTPLLARLDALVTGNTLVGLRALPALGLAAMVLLTASMARALGADRRGELIAALATACCAVYLGAMHEFTTTAPDFVGWAVTLLLVTRLLRSGNPRWWLAIGAVAGLGMSAKWNIGFLVAGLLLGFALSPAARPLLRSRFLACGAVAFAVLASPDFAWQAMHGWPNLAVFRWLQQDAWANRAAYWPDQVLYTSIVLAPLWVRGAAWSLRSVRYRPLGIAAVAVICLQFALGGKPYYPDASYTFLFAAGATALAPRSAAGARLAPGTGPVLRRCAVYCLGAAVSSLVSLSVLPAAALARVPLQKVNYDLGEQIGWPSEVKLLSTVWDSLPAAERARAALVTANYGEAGAVDRYGAAFGLPHPYSGHNNFWLWGPPPAADATVVAIGIGPAQLRREFKQVTQVAVFHNGLGVADDEEGTLICVATGLRAPWASAWPAFKNLS